MNETKKILRETQEINNLAKNLSISSHVTKFDNKKYNEAHELSYAFSEIEESSYKFLFDLLPKLKTCENEDEIYDLLLEIGEEFRHILYHITATKFYDYLNDTE